MVHRTTGDIFMSLKKQGLRSRVRGNLRVSLYGLLRTRVRRKLNQRIIIIPSPSLVRTFQPDAKSLGSIQRFCPIGTHNVELCFRFSFTKILGQSLTQRHNGAF